MNTGSAVIRLLCLMALMAATPVFAQDIETLDPNFAKVDPDSNLAWYDALTLGVSGQGWTDVAAPYDRLPAHAEATAPPAVWSLSRHSAGLAIHFQSDAPAVSVRWSLLNGNLAMAHMPATGVSGVDLYARDGDTWRFVANGRPDRQEGNEAKLAGNAREGMNEFLLYLPLYNGTTKVELGINPDARIAKATGEQKKPVVVYGTSIVHGGCASRPGMAYPSILGRRLARSAINLGFSGNGRMEMAMAEIIGTLDPAVFVLDCLPNMSPEQVTARVVPFVNRLRELHPDTPIVLCENVTYQGSWFSTQPGGHVAKNEALQAEYKKLRDAGVQNIYYLPGENFLGDDMEATVDGTHPTDLGFMRQADALEPILREALGE